MLFNTHAHTLSFFGTSRTHHKVTLVINETEFEEEVGATLLGNKYKVSDPIYRNYFGDVKEEEFTIEVTLEKSAMGSLIREVRSVDAPLIHFSGLLTGADGVYTTWSPDSFDGKTIKILQEKHDISGEDKLLEKITESYLGKTRFEDVSIVIESKVGPQKNQVEDRIPRG